LVVGLVFVAMIRGQQATGDSQKCLSAVAPPLFR
jgi:hypothetical protein